MSPVQQVTVILLMSSFAIYKVLGTTISITAQDKQFFFSSSLRWFDFVAIHIFRTELDPKVLMVPRDSFGLLPSCSIRLELRMINRYHHKADKKSVWKHLAGRMRDLEGKKKNIFYIKHKT